MIKKSLLVLVALASTGVNAEESVIDKGIEKAKEFVKVEEGESIVKISGSYTPWFVTWEQVSTAKSKFGASAINVDYSIDGAIAHTGKLNVEVKSFDFDLELIELPENKEGIEKTMSHLSAGINYVLPVAETKLAYRYTQASFEGAIEGVDDDGERSVGTFETDAITHNITAITKWGLGIGYRSFTYDLPQDVYLVASSSPTTPILKGFTNMNYESDFLEFVFEQDELLNNDTAKFNIGVAARYGFGKMNVGGEFVEAVRDTHGDDIVGEADATILELDIYGYMPVIKSSSFEADIVFGYRTETLSAEFPGGEQYSLVTDFETNFSGPYATLNFIW